MFNLPFIGLSVYPSQLKNRCPSNHWDWSRPLPIEPVASDDFEQDSADSECRFGVPAPLISAVFPLQLPTSNYLILKEMRGCCSERMLHTRGVVDGNITNTHPSKTENGNCCLFRVFQVHPFTLRRMRTPLRLASSIRDGNSCLSF